LKRDREEIQNEIKDFRENLIDRWNSRKGRIWVMDEAGIWNDPVVERSYSQIITPNGHGRDTIIACVSNTGEKLPLYYINHRPKKFGIRTNGITGERYRVITDKGCSGLTNEFMLQWVEFFLEQPQVTVKKDILCYDQHRSHLNQAVMEKLLSKGLVVLSFPKGSAPELSMCDNSLFRDYKRDFVKLWEKENYELLKKEEIAYQTWKEFPESRITGYWRKCGFPEKRSRRRTQLIEQVTEESIQIRKRKRKKTTANTVRIESFFMKKNGKEEDLEIVKKNRNFIVCVTNNLEK
jgi:hypothetical protein